MSPNRQRRFFSPQDKVAAIRRHLLEKIPISQICEELGIAPNLFYIWQRDFFENGQAAFQSKTDRRQIKRTESTKDQKIDLLQDKIRRKDEVLAELMEEYVSLKKKLGGI